jgi:putative membrane protein
VVWAGVAAVIAMQIAYPLVHGDARNALTVATVLAFAATSIAHATVVGGARLAAVELLAAGGIGFAAEVLGVRTGVPFGRYHYTGGLGPSLASVPLVIPLAWLMMAHPAMRVATHVARRPVTRCGVATLALAGWDVYLDPQMVAAGHWRWADPTVHPPGVPQVPLSNYGGWLLVALVVMAVLTVTDANRPSNKDAPALTLWMWTWLASALADIAFLHLGAAAGWGFLAMGVVGVPLGRRLVRS